jgi:hypothetical protein
MRFARWAAVILWLAAASYAFSTLMTDEFATVADWGTTAICVALAALIALGGRPGLIAAIGGTGLAALATIVGLGFGQLELAVAAAGLTVACALTVRDFRRTDGVPNP